MVNTITTFQSDASHPPLSSRLFHALAMVRIRCSTPLSDVKQHLDNLHLLGCFRHSLLGHLRAYVGSLHLFR